jgi:hypothetical protein
MSSRRGYTDHSEGEIVLQCSFKHRLGFIVVPRRSNPRLDRLARVDQRLKLGATVPARSVPVDHPLRELCPACKNSGRSPSNYDASWAEIVECVEKLRDTPSTTLTLFQTL